MGEFPGADGDSAGGYNSRARCEMRREVENRTRREAFFYTVSTPTMATRKIGPSNSPPPLTR